MRSKNDSYYICEDGHLTVGSGRKEKCDAKVIPMAWEKDETKRKGKKWSYKEGEEKACGKIIKEVHDIPKELKFEEVWEYQKLKAFFTGQRPEDFAFFAQTLQEEFVKITARLNKLEEGKQCLK